jgi:hypothetical protein
MANMQNSRDFVAKSQGAFGDMARLGQSTVSDAKGAFADMTSTGGKGGMAEPGEDQETHDADGVGVFADKGGWMYRDLGDGRIEIMQAPQGSKMAGKVLDPTKIPTISNASQRARAQRAYDSIQRVMAGGEPLSSGSGGGGKKAQAPTPADSSRAAGGAVDRPAAGSFSEPIRDTLSGVTGPPRPARGGSRP